MSTWDEINRLINKEPGGYRWYYIIDRQFRGWMESVACGMVKDLDQAKDIVAEVLEFKLIDWVRSQEGNVSINQAFLRRMVANKCLDFLRKGTKTVPLGEQHDMAASTTMQFDELDSLVNDLMLKAEEELAPRLLKVWRIRQNSPADRTDAQMAEELGMKLDTFRVYKSEAEKQLKESVKHHLPGYLRL